MTLVDTDFYPYPAGEEYSKAFMVEFLQKLEDRDRDIVRTLNGVIEQWTPNIEGNITSGVGTYERQVGWYLRQGLFVDIWMDVKWTSHTGSGDIEIPLVYQAANSAGTPWVGTIELGLTSPTFTAGSWLTWNVEPNTNNSTITENNSSGAFNVPLSSSGTLIGHLRYIGKQNET